MANTVYAQQRYGTIDGRPTALLAVGSVAATPEEVAEAAKVGGEAHGWMIVFVPWRPEMEGQTPKIRIGGTGITNGKRSRIEVEGTVTKIAGPRTKGLRRSPYEAWGKQYTDFPEGLQVRKEVLEQLYSKIDGKLDMSESSLEEDEKKPEESDAQAQVGQRRKAPSTGEREKDAPEMHTPRSKAGEKAVAFGDTSKRRFLIGTPPNSVPRRTRSSSPRGVSLTGAVPKLRLSTKGSPRASPGSSSESDSPVRATAKLEEAARGAPEVTVEGPTKPPLLDGKGC